MGTSTGRGHEHSHSQNRFAVPPTPLRLGVDSERTGRGVTIAFLDSGFYPHPDLTQPINRIVAYEDITSTGASLQSNRTPDDSDWHGTMTSVAGAGNGRLSDGVYRGLASEARLVLVKVSDRGKITEPNIERGLRWVIANKDRYNIRVISISLGGDDDVSYQQNAVDQAAEDAVRAGMVVVVAAGNSGCTERHKTVPPANAPSVITVGGYDDNNKPGSEPALYCSSFGVTADGIVKPEVIAPAMWVAAPILPGTDAYRRAEAVSIIASSPDYMIREIARAASGGNENGLWKRADLPDWLRVAAVDAIRAELSRLLEEGKIIAAHYQHVDGTSFAAPVIASLVALMIEANPLITPAAVKHILISTANRIGSAPAIRQGYGVVDATRALEEAERESHFAEELFDCPPRVVDRRLEFTHHNDSASSVSLAGDFNNWDHTRVPLARTERGNWRAEIDAPLPGVYRYKLVIDGRRWIEDPANLIKEPDGYGGFNSVLQIS
ncbi:MAG TPA: S8 family serine peptidase [Blastocatellia bacterium]|nr:S8 family serine peptidase [Blastocatellia bacterium]